MKTTRDMIVALERQSAGFRQEIEALQLEEKQTRAGLDKVGGELEAAWEHLVNVLVPSLQADVLDRAAARLHLRDVAAAVTQQRIAADTARLAEIGRRIQGDERWVKREAVQNEAHIRLAELDEAIRPLQQSVGQLESEPHFRRLIQTGYGTDQYGGRFWQTSYYSDWKNGDLIVEKFGSRYGVEDFGGLRAKYLGEREALVPLTANRREWQQKLKDVAELEEQLARAQEDLANMTPRQLAWARGRVRAHLESLPPADLTALLAHDEELRVAAARVAGARAKLDYLEQLVREMIQPAIADLRSAGNKANRDIVKMKRTKNAGRMWSDADYDRRFGKDRRASWDKRRGRIRDVRTRVVEFHHYDRWSPAQDFLWWDVMTDGQLDGNFIHEVRERGPAHRPEAWAAAQPSSDDLVRDIS